MTSSPDSVPVQETLLKARLYITVAAAAFLWLTGTGTGTGSVLVGSAPEDATGAPIGLRSDIGVLFVLIGRREETGAVSARGLCRKTSRVRRVASINAPSAQAVRAAGRLPPHGGSVPWSGVSPAP